MSSRTAVDSNVLIAAGDEDDVHHRASAAILNAADPGEIAVPVHCYAETYSQLTRGDRPFRWSPQRAADYMANVAANTRLIGATPDETLEAVLLFVGSGGVGPRLYDHLIGSVAVASGINRLITWNVGHMRSLFPNLEVLTPEDALALAPSKDRP
jgi:predicted nucleic acid-binding protein